MSLTITHRRIISRGDLVRSAGGIYNPGAVLLGSTIHLLCRREIDYRLSPRVFAERLILDADTLNLISRRTLKKHGFEEDSRIEDFRCIEFDGELLAVHSLVERGRVKPVISRVEAERIVLHDDFRLPLPPSNHWEKNWVLFNHQGELHCLYKLDPLTIFVRREGCWRLVKEEESGWADDYPRMLSNSTNLIPFRDGYLGFWHTILDGSYVNGAFLLGHDLTIRHRTGILLDSSTVRGGNKPGVLYVSSLVEHAGRVLAFYGEGDAHTAVAILDAEELARELLATSMPMAQPIRIRYHGEDIGDVFRALTALHGFSAERGHPLIWLYVSDLRLRPAIDAFKVPNLSVRSLRSNVSHDFSVTGRSGAIDVCKEK